MVLLCSFGDQIAIQFQLTDEWIHLGKGGHQNGLFFQIAAHELVVKRFHSVRQFTRLFDPRSPEALGHRQHALDAADRWLPGSVQQGLADHAGPRRSRQQLRHRRRRALGLSVVVKPMAATRLPRMFPQQLAGHRIEDAHEAAVELHVDRVPDPARRHAVVSRFDLHTAVHMHAPLACS